MSENITPRWITNIIHTCMGLKCGEKIIFIMDEPLGHARNALLTEAAKVNPSEIWSYTFPDAARPFSEYPPQLLTTATQMDVVVLLLAALDPVKEHPA